jgi:hypothetical protein
MYLRSHGKNILYVCRKKLDFQMDPNPIKILEHRQLFEHQLITTCLQGEKNTGIC